MDDTILCFTSDHGEMLGNHGLWAKHWFYEDSARVPMILSGTRSQSDSGQVGHHRRDDRLVGLADVMPTLLELAGLDVPDHCQGLSMVGSEQRDVLFGAFSDRSESEGCSASRMVRDRRYKLIYYPAGNVTQLFDMLSDPRERVDRARDGELAQGRQRLTGMLVGQLSTETERSWLRDGKLIGLPDAQPSPPRPNRGYSGQRGIQWPSP
jgi:arylsulfatase A-like enzyme